jgi:hypothetical protein
MGISGELHDPAAFSHKRNPPPVHIEYKPEWATVGLKALVKDHISCFYLASTHNCLYVRPACSLVNIPNTLFRVQSDASALN